MQRSYWDSLTQIGANLAAWTPFVILLAGFLGVDLDDAYVTETLGVIGAGIGAAVGLVMTFKGYNRAVDNGHNPVNAPF